MSYDKGFGLYDLMPNDEYCSSQTQDIDSGLIQNKKNSPAIKQFLKDLKNKNYNNYP